MIRPSYASLAASTLGLSTAHQISAIEDYVVVNPDNIVSFVNAPPQLSEIDEIIEQVTGALMHQHGFLFTVQPNQLEIISNRIFTLLSCPVRRQTMLNILSDTDMRPSVTSSSVLSWKSIKSQYKCGICDDVLASPVLCHCLHSFCGQCLLELTHNGSDSFCPECTKPIGKSNLYERNLALKIERLVLEADDCQSKAEWHIRNNKYKEHRSQEELKIYERFAEVEEQFSFEDFARENLIPITVLCLLAIEVLRRR